MLKSSMLAAQAAQLKELDAMFERDNKEMKSTQAKVITIFMSMVRCTIFSVMRRYRTNVSHSVSQSLTLRTELTDVTLVSEDTC